eukprot:1163550-Amphidinium_carterae.1
MVQKPSEFEPYPSITGVWGPFLLYPQTQKKVHASRLRHQFIPCCVLRPAISWNFVLEVWHQLRVLGENFWLPWVGEEVSPRECAGGNSRPQHADPGGL